MYNAMASFYPLIAYNLMIPSLLKELLDTQETAVNQLTDNLHIFYHYHIAFNLYIS